MSIIGGGTEALVQLMARRKLEEQQNMLRALTVADKQEQWNADRERIRQVDEQIAQTKKNQDETRRQFGVGQENTEAERAYRRTANKAKGVLPGPSDRATYDEFNKEGFTGIVTKTPGAVLRLGGGSNVGPVQTPGGAIAAGSGVQTDDSFESRGGSDWQMARALSGEKAEALKTAQLGLSERQEDKQKFDLLMRQMDATTRTAVAGIMAAARGQITPATENSILGRLTTQADKVTGPYRELKRQHNLMSAGMQAALAGNQNFGGQAIINTFNKILDPLSVVRESEYARTQEGLAVLTRLEGLVQKWKDGGTGVPVAELQKMYDLATTAVKGYERLLAPQLRRTAAQAEQQKQDPKLIIGEDMMGILNADQDAPGGVTIVKVERAGGK
jgi:hypothetical protein